MAPADVSPASVLLVDDNSDNLLALAAVLERLKLRLVPAGSGNRALELAGREEFAAIILDVQMPGLDGYQTARLLRARPGGERTPIIFLTANSHDPGASLRGYAEGAVDFLVKPFDPAILRSKVSVFVSLFEARRTVQRQEALLREHALQKQRRESEARYQSLAEAVPQIVWSADETGRVVYGNPAWEQLLGAPPERLEWQDVVHPEDLERVRAASERAWARQGVFQEMYRLRAADGTYRWHLGRAVQIRDAEGRPVGWVGTATDVDEQRRSEERSRFLSEASSALGASLELGDVLGRVCALAVPAAADLCAVHLRQQTGTVRELVAVPSVRERIEALGEVDPGLLLGVDEALSSGARVSWTASPGSPERLGLERCLSVPLVNRGEVLGVLTLGLLPARDPGFLSDALADELARRIALAVDNARLYEDAREAVRLRDEFLSVASHELRTPLTPLNLKLGMIRRLAEQAGEGTLPAPQIAADVGVAVRHVQRLTSLVDHLLDVTRIRAGKLLLQLESVDLTEVVRDAAARQASVAGEVGSTIQVEAPERCVGVWDRMRLEQIVTNLLTNALKYGAGKPVQLRLEAQGTGQVVLSVRDSGVGMEPAVLERIFGRFERGHSGRHYPGLGLGLYITRQIVTALEGTISVESAPGEGAVFTVTLPRGRAVADQRSEPAGAQEATPEARQGARGV